MIQMRWTDEKVWKDCPEFRSIEMAEESWSLQVERAKLTRTKIPPGVEFREVPDRINY